MGHGKSGGGTDAQGESIRREQRYRESLVNVACAAVVLDGLARPAMRVGVTDRGTRDRMEGGLDEGRSKLKQAWGDATDNQCP